MATSSINSPFGIFQNLSALEQLSDLPSRRNEDQPNGFL